MGDKARRKAQRRIDQVRAVDDRHGAMFHVTWVGAALVVIVAGLAMMVLPGPALVVLPIGVAMLAVVFGWARRLLLFGADEGAEAAHARGDAPTWMKVVTVVTVAAGAAGLAAWLFL